MNVCCVNLAIVKNDGDAIFYSYLEKTEKDFNR